MKQVFADTAYWIALINKRDSLYDKAREVSESLGKVHIVTSDSVLAELLNFYAGWGAELRKSASDAGRHILQDANVSVVQQTRDLFFEGIALYKNRPDKKYSLTDCISMEIMRKKGINEILTHDRHFRQEGYKVLL